MVHSAPRSSGLTLNKKLKATRIKRATLSQRSVLRPSQNRFSAMRLDRWVSSRIRSLLVVVRVDWRCGATCARACTQVSLLLPPRCMVITRESGPVATRVRPPGITT